MPLTPETRNGIRTYLKDVTIRYVSETPIALSKPYHRALLPGIDWGPISEHSFSTKTGTWFPEMARLVALQFHPVVRTQYRVDGKLRNAASTVINDIVRQFDAPGRARRKPNRATDLQDALQHQSPGGEDKFWIVDFYVQRHDGSELFFELKTPQPNKAHAKNMKEMVLHVMAMKKGEAAEAFGACGYNPWNPDGNAEGYSWGYTKQYLEVGRDFLVGRQFWEKLGEPSTYDEVWDVAQIAGAEVQGDVERVLAARTAQLREAAAAD